MPTLYVENVPEDLYNALRSQARRHRRSIAAEVLSLLEENVATREELKRRRMFLDKVRRLRSLSPVGIGPFPTAEEMQREDRGR